MRTAPQPVAAASFGLLATQLKVLILMLILLSIGCLLARTQARNTPGMTQGHLRSTWFNSLPGSGNTIASAGPRNPGRRVADQPALTARS